MDNLERPNSETSSQRPRARVERRSMARVDTYKLNEGTRNEIVVRGRFYTLKPGVTIRSAPAEKRDSEIILESVDNQLFFAVQDQAQTVNGVRYSWGFILQKQEGQQKAQYVDRGYIETVKLRAKKAR